MNDRSANIFSLFASTSTLICCALPALFVTLGAGASFASLLSVFPFLIVASQYKVQISLAALVMIGLAGYIHYRTARLPCPTDPELGRACLTSRARARYVYYFSVSLFIFASLFTYVVPRVV
ncbi:MAG: hypothetical protein CMQ44_01155 [Gammaproteobacteria bacterium]|nr:hypothetical protein [Gammaproteobacteria bacterium]